MGKGQSRGWGDMKPGAEEDEIVAGRVLRV